MTHCCQNVCGFLKLLPESTERHLVQLNPNEYGECKHGKEST